MKSFSNRGLLLKKEYAVRVEDISLKSRSLLRRDKMKMAGSPPLKVYPFTLHQMLLREMSHDLLLAK